jgi:hypothetical protein
MKPFLQGRNVQKSSTLRPLSTGASSAVAGAKSAICNSEGVNVETVKDGDKVVRIVVTCVCGERIEIDCLYPPGT